MAGEVSQREVGTGIIGTTATIRKQLETPTIHEKSKQNGRFTPFF